MKKIYWRPQSTPLFAFVLIAFIAVGGLASVEHFQIVKRKPFYLEKVEASNLALGAMELVRDERLDRGIPIDPQTDPTGSGMIGSFVTSVTSEAAELEAKQTSVNPNFAAITVELLKEAGVKDGDPDSSQLFRLLSGSQHRCVCSHGHASSEAYHYLLCKLFSMGSK